MFQILYAVIYLSYEASSSICILVHPASFIHSFIRSVPALDNIQLLSLFIQVNAMAKFNLSIYMTFTFFLLCTFFWLQTDAIKSRLSGPVVGIPIQTDAEIDRLLLQDMLSKQKKNEEEQQPMDTWNLSDGVIDDFVDTDEKQYSGPAAMESAKPVAEIRMA